MQITNKSIDQITPYENNPRKNDKSVTAVASSIQHFGFKVPIIVDSNNIIVAGHTRYKAAVKLKLDTIPCIVADDLTDQQIKAFRLADNKVGETSEWDFDLLAAELQDIFDIDMSDLGFDDYNSPDDDNIAIDLDDDNDKSNQKQMQTCHCPKCGFEFKI